MSKNVLITGAVQGIGRSIARKFAEHGYGVVINYRNPDKEKEAQEFAEECSRISGTDCICLQADVSDPEKCRWIVEETVNRFGSLDVLVNNAGVMKYSLLQNLKDDDYRKIVSSNQDSVFFMMKYAAKYMIKKKNGSIINMASVAGIYGSATISVYSATKAAVISMTKVAATELAYKKVRVNAVAPGMVNTQMTNSIPQEGKESMCRNIPMRRFAEPNEVANAVYWLASDEASYVTGEILEVSGGLK